MTSGIFAVANIGAVKLYVGQVSHLKTRWPQMMAQLDQGIFADTVVQQAWALGKSDRRFTFHTADDINHNNKIRGRKLFLKDSNCQ